MNKQRPNLEWLRWFFKRSKEVGEGAALFEIYEHDSRVKTDLKGFRSAPGPLHIDRSPKEKP